MNVWLIVGIGVSWVIASAALSLALGAYIGRSTGTESCTCPDLDLDLDDDEVDRRFTGLTTRTTWDGRL